MNYRLISKILGRILVLESAAMIPALIISIVTGDGMSLSFIISMTILLIVGAPFAFLLKSGTGSIRPREGFVSVALCWIAISLFGALPEFISGSIPNYVDAFFETVSGFTTTGATILTDIESLSKSIVFWRSFTQWLGGMGVLILTLAILPEGERGIHNLMRAEATGPSAERIVPRLRKTAVILYVIYVALSVVQALMLIFGGMNVFDSIIHAFGTAATGGFSNYNLSVGAYNNAYFEYVIGVFMLLFSVNFGLYFAALTRKFVQIKKNTEFKAFFVIIVASTILITVNLVVTGGYNSVGLAIRHAFFQVSSTSSSTGFATTDFNMWPEFSKTILLVLMAIGACASSTGGGLKVIRVLMLFKSAGREMKKILHPRSVNAVRINGQPVPDKTLMGVMHYFTIYILILIFSTLLVSLDNFGFEKTFSSVLSAISNTGPYLDSAYHGSSFAGFSALSKLVLSVCMLVGRLEIMPMLMLIVPSSWKHR